MPFQIVRNDITKMQVDAIVNTANPKPGFGPGIDTAVYEGAGKEKLLAKRFEIGIIDPGNAVITEGFDLPAKYIIHTVGTAWQGGSFGEEKIIRACYQSVFRLADENKVQSLAIPLLASGSFGFPKGIALRIALSEIAIFISDHDIDVYLVVFDDKSVALSNELYGDIDEYISDNYVEEKAAKEYSYPHEERRKRFSRVSFDRADEMPVLMCAEPMAASNAAPKFASKDEADDHARSLDEVIGDIKKTFMELVFSFADEKGISDVELQKRANLGRKAFSKLKCGTTKNPSKSTALALAIGLELNLDEAKDLLSRAGLALSPCSKQDIIVQYFIEKEAYDIYEINVALFEHGESLLGSQAS